MTFYEIGNVVITSHDHHGQFVWTSYSGIPSYPPSPFINPPAMCHTPINRRVFLCLVLFVAKWHTLDPNTLIVSLSSSLCTDYNKQGGLPLKVVLVYRLFNVLQ